MYETREGGAHLGEQAMRAPQLTTQVLVLLRPQLFRTLQLLHLRERRVQCVPQHVVLRQHL
jgi:hypothetical protein